MEACSSRSLFVHVGLFWCGELSDGGVFSCLPECALGGIEGFGGAKWFTCHEMARNGHTSNGHMSRSFFRTGREIVTEGDRAWS
jgi:hypothetical protein